MVEKPKSNIWLTEVVSASELHLTEVQDILYQETTPFQQIAIVKLVDTSKALYLDNQLQSNTRDEYIYHELIIHVPFVIQQQPKSVLIIGAGEGASAREALKWQSITTLQLIELDPAVIRCCKEYLPEMNQGAYDHPKVQIAYQEAQEFLLQCKVKYDVIICDLCDQDLEKNSIINVEFLLACKQILNKNGNIFIQSGELPYQKDRKFLNYIKMLQSVFQQLKIFTTWIPSYCRNWAFILLQDEQIESFDYEKVQEIIAENIKGELQFFDGNTFLGLCNPPKFVKNFEE